MSGITKCENEDCPLKEKCYRYLAPPNSERQAYGDFKPDENGNCEYYWERYE
ncbi:MAG TPA: hypothetical protein VLA13_05595 [Massilibacterium sp.]|nr:hypothetical protein [Massilibacterium sp.]